MTDTLERVPRFQEREYVRPSAELFLGKHALLLAAKEVHLPPGFNEYLHQSRNLEGLPATVLAEAEQLRADRGYRMFGREWERHLEVRLTKHENPAAASTRLKKFGYAGDASDAVPLLNLEGERYLSRLHAYARYSDEPQVALWARDTLILANGGLVATAVDKLRLAGERLQVASSYGHEGLMVAIDKFNPATGLKLSTVAMWWIRQTIDRGMHTEKYGKDRPQNESSQIRAFLNRIRGHGLDEDSPVREIAKKSKMEVEGVEKMIKAIRERNTLSINRAPSTRDESVDSEIGDVLLPVTDNLDFIDSDFLIQVTSQVIMELRDDRLAEIFQEYFLPDDDIRPTIKELAHSYGVYERTMQSWLKSIKKVARPIVRRYLEKNRNIR